MKILYQHPKCCVIEGDALEAMQWIKSVDVSLTDPPYTSHVHDNIRSVNTSDPGKPRVRIWEPGFAPLAGYEGWQRQLATTKTWSLNFCALEQFGEYLASAGGWRKTGGLYVRSWIWRKGQAAPQLSGNCPANSCEGIAVGHSAGGSMVWNGRGSHAWYDGEREEFQDSALQDNAVFSNRDKAEKRHPNQKPDLLCQSLVRKFTFEDQLVGDWYCGSGALAAACLKARRRVIAVDKDPYWAAFTALRCARILSGDLSHEPRSLAA
jgi:hypothetical protein